jgi:hypothetical protein
MQPVPASEIVPSENKFVARPADGMGPLKMASR